MDKRFRTKEEIDSEIKRLYELAKSQNSKFSDAFWRKNANFTLKPVFRQYGGFYDALKNFYEIYKYNEQFEVTKEKVIEDILFVHELALTNDEKFNLRFYQKNTKYSLSYLCHYFDSYQDAIEKLQLTNNILPTPNREEYVQEILELYSLHGYISVSLLGSESKYKCKGLRYLKDFGGLVNILEELNIPYHKKNVFKAARQVIDYAAKHLNEEPIFEKTWDWLKNPQTKYNMFVDCYFPNHNLVIEYHGKQHYEYNDYFHKTYEDFLGLQSNDKLKKQLIIDRNIKFIEVSYKEKRSYENIVKLIQNNVYN